MRGGHLCGFEGVRREPLEAGDRPACDRVGCRKPAVGYGVFPWGASALCAKHLDEDAPERGEREVVTTSLTVRTSDDCKRALDFAERHPSPSRSYLNAIEALLAEVRAEERAIIVAGIRAESKRLKGDHTPRSTARSWDFKDLADDIESRPRRRESP